MKTPLKLVLLGVGVVGVGLVALKIKDLHEDVYPRHVHIDGLPCQDSLLVTPIVIEAAYEGGLVTALHNGGESPRLELPDDEELELRVRIGRCTGDHWNYDCSNPEWSREHLVAVDTRYPDADVRIGLPKDKYACMTSVATSRR